MLCGTHRLALALGAIVSMTSAGSAACTDHTFDPCPEPVSGYALEVDPKSGRTWLKEAKVAAADTSTSTSTLGRLSAAAKKVPAGSLAKAQAPPPPEPEPSEAVNPPLPEQRQAQAVPEVQREAKKAPRTADWHTQVRRYRKPLK